MKKYNYSTVTISYVLALFSVLLGISCSSVEKEPEKEDVFSVKENGKSVFYSTSDKAFGDVYLGMPKHMVDSLLSNFSFVTIFGREYETICEYSRTGMLSSFYLRSDTVSIATQDSLIDELEDVISVKYGKLNMTYVSELPMLGISKKTTVDGKVAHWGSHWNEGSKYIVLGTESADSTRCVWVWIFNTNLWTKLGDDKAKQEANNF